MKNNTKIAVIGSGTMGNGIAHVFSQANFDTLLVDINKNQLIKAMEVIEKNLERQIKKNIISVKDKDNILRNIKTSDNIDDCKEIDLVIEAIPEKYELKVSLFKKLDNICKSSTIFASNTSSISISNLGNQTNRPDKMIGMHFMNPVPIMKLVEIINTIHTSDLTTNKIVEVTKKIMIYQ